MEAVENNLDLKLMKESEENKYVLTAFGLSRKVANLSQEFTNAVRETPHGIFLENQSWRIDPHLEILVEQVFLNYYVDYTLPVFGSMETWINCDIAAKVKGIIKLESLSSLQRNWQPYYDLLTLLRKRCKENETIHDWESRQPFFGTLHRISLNDNQAIADHREKLRAEMYKNASQGQVSDNSTGLEWLSKKILLYAIWSWTAILHMLNFSRRRTYVAIMGIVAVVIAAGTLFVSIVPVLIKKYKNREKESNGPDVFLTGVAATIVVVSHSCDCLNTFVRTKGNIVSNLLRLMTNPRSVVKFLGGLATLCIVSRKYNLSKKVNSKVMSFIKLRFDDEELDMDDEILGLDSSEVDVPQYVKQVYPDVFDFENDWVDLDKLWKIPTGDEKLAHCLIHGVYDPECFKGRVTPEGIKNTFFSFWYDLVPEVRFFIIAVILICILYMLKFVLDLAVPRKHNENCILSTHNCDATQCHICDARRQGLDCTYVKCHKDGTPDVLVVEGGSFVVRRLMDFETFVSQKGVVLPAGVTGLSAQVRYVKSKEKNESYNKDAERKRTQAEWQRVYDEYPLDSEWGKEEEWTQNDYDTYADELVTSRQRRRSKDRREAVIIPPKSIDKGKEKIIGMREEVTENSRKDLPLRKVMDEAMNSDKSKLESKIVDARGEVKAVNVKNARQARLTLVTSDGQHLAGAESISMQGCSQPYICCSWHEIEMNCGPTLSNGSYVFATQPRFKTHDGKFIEPPFVRCDPGLDLACFRKEMIATDGTQAHIKSKRLCKPGFDLMGERVTIIYEGDDGEEFASGQVVLFKSDENLAHYDCPTIVGASGEAVLLNRPGNAVAGIHVKRGEGQKYNVFVPYTVLSSFLVSIPLTSSPSLGKED